MKRPICLAAIILLVLLIAYPAQAFTADSLAISVKDNGDASVTFDYTLTWMENLAVFMRVADPATELRNALESNFKKPVTILGVSDREAQFVVRDFAQVSRADSATTWKTPGLSFAAADNVLKQYWFAPLVNPDFSPAVTEFTFPDRYKAEFENKLEIGPIIHTESED